MNFEAPILILGVERSGSTWVSNILDAHSKTLLLLEPFASQVAAFPDHPGRLVSLEESNALLSRHVTRRFKDLVEYKYPLLHRRAAPFAERQLVYRGLYPLGEVAAKGLDFFGLGRPKAHVRFKNLNKNRIENPYLHRCSKDASPARLVVKELRLNFQVGLVADLWPDARILITIRNPVSQVDSMVRRIEGGGLHELRRALHGILEQARTWTRFEPYHEALSDLNRDRLLHRALAYWIVNYSALISDLDRCGLDFRVVRHEDLSQAPAEEAKGLMEFADLADQEQVRDFVAWSSQGGTGGESIMDTQRASGRYYLEALDRVDDEVRKEVRQGLQGLWSRLPPSVQRYKPWLEEHL